MHQQLGIIRRLDRQETSLIQVIARWYFDEWETPMEKTVKRLSTQPSDDVLFQCVVTKGGRLIATGGLSHQVNILNVYPHLRTLGPWVALLYTERDHRGQGCGQMLLHAIETEARAEGLKTIFLYTFTAERLYKRNGWEEIERVTYKGHETVVMGKDIAIGEE